LKEIDAEVVFQQVTFPILRGRLLKIPGVEQNGQPVRFPILRGRLLKWVKK